MIQQNTCTENLIQKLIGEYKAISQPRYSMQKDVEEIKQDVNVIAKYRDNQQKSIQKQKEEILRQQIIQVRYQRSIT